MINCEREKLEFESLPEFIREPYSATRENFIPPPSIKYALEEGWEDPAAASKPAAASRPAAPKSAALEALWPGVNHEFLQPTRRAPSFYLTLGFMAGAVVSLAVVWAYSVIAQGGLPNAPDFAKKIVVAGEKGSLTTSHNQITTDRGTAAGQTTIVSGAEVIAPLFSEYEVKSGDTLAAIALQAYRRVSPRLIDEICRANNMRSPNVLNLGQKLVLPEYRSQPKQLAGTAQVQ